MSFDLKPKRKATDDASSELFPYYAGFSPRFADDVLKLAAVTRRSVVLDPLNGAGTTTNAAARLGAFAWGFDLNPAACLAAKARLELVSGNVPAPMPDWKTFTRLRTAPDADPLARWLPTDVVGWIRAGCSWVLNGHAFPECIDTLTGRECLWLLVLLNVARSLAVPERASNPTWTRDANSKARVMVSREKFQNTVRSCHDRAVAIATAVLRPAEGCAFIQVADVRNLPLADESVDVVLTSPPYCTRIDYARATRFELDFLGLGCATSAADDLRKALMGTTAIRCADGTAGIPSTLPPRVQRLLAAIRDHTSYASKHYYFKNFLQYFMDANDACRELTRVVGHRGTLYLVVQNSFYKELEIDLASAYADLFHQYGFESAVIAEQAASKFFSSIHPFGRARAAHRDYTEKVLRVRRSRRRRRR